MHVLRRDRGCTGQRMLRLEVPGKRRRGRPKRKFMDVVRGGYAGDRCDRAGFQRQGEMEKDVLLWRSLMGAAERQRRIYSTRTPLVPNNTNEKT